MPASLEIVLGILILVGFLLAASALLVALINSPTQRKR